ncbi:hypothetical protein CSUI_002087 [Cystoisospora suis]|uniref:Uncharacterized protein n=1 Tax=Cystoisospora suis TaxID=483139 RepID=A0A2C6LA86_9APIC|nr:hypothetical protein CSUI_002087 [Cystoisospora suis]
MLSVHTPYINMPGVHTPYINMLGVYTPCIIMLGVHTTYINMLGVHTTYQYVGCAYTLSVCGVYIQPTTFRMYVHVPYQCMGCMHADPSACVYACKLYQYVGYVYAHSMSVSC